MATAGELVEQAQRATTSAELDEIEAQAEGRITVQRAVDDRRAALSQPQQQGESTVSESETSQTSQTTKGSASSSQDVRESAGEGEVKTDALGNELEKAEAQQLADPSEVKEFGTDKQGNPITALMSEGETGAGGLALPKQGEIAGGNIAAVLAPPPSSTTLQRPLAKEQAALLSDTGQKIAALLGRPVTEWGVLGPGDVIKGHMLLLDLNTGEKVRAADGHRIKDGELYMNLRNAPESLATGDTIEKVLGG